MNDPVGLTVFFPAYNDSGTIASVVIAAVRTAARLTTDFEVLVIDDGSSDATPEIADELARRGSRQGARTGHPWKETHHAA